MAYERKSKFGTNDSAIVKARARFGAALRDCDEEAAVAATRELVRARRAYRMRKDIEALAATGQRVDEATS
jgi:hypothetical protein